MSNIQSIEALLAANPQPVERLQLFKHVVESEFDLTTEFLALKKLELLQRISPALRSRCKTEKKEILANRAFSHLLDKFVAGRAVAFNPGFTPESFKAGKRAGILTMLEGDIK